MYDLAFDIENGKFYITILHWSIRQPSSSASRTETPLKSLSLWIEASLRSSSMTISGLVEQRSGSRVQKPVGHSSFDFPLLYSLAMLLVMKR